jgi:flavorubredoxin
MNKRRICMLLFVITIAGLVTTAAIVLGLNSREIVRDVEIRNPTGSKGTVFVLFRPGVTGFNEDIVNAFIRGLIQSDWRVEVTTSSRQTPTNVTAYNLIVLGAPTNGGKPHQSMLDYIARVNFGGKSVVLILTSGGDGVASMGYFRNATINANGTVLSELRFQLFESGAADRAYTAGTEVTL